MGQSNAPLITCKSPCIVAPVSASARVSIALSEYEGSELQIAHTNAEPATIDIAARSPSFQMRARIWKRRRVLKTTSNHLKAILNVSNPHARGSR
jgi:hypothetical protein